MIVVALTGVPGSGKSTVSRALHSKRPTWGVLSLHDWIEKEGLLSDFDPQRWTFEVDVDLLRRRFLATWERGREDPPVLLVEGHLAHYISPDLCLLLRIHPLELRRRLKERAWTESKIQENVEAEALDVLVFEVLDEVGPRRSFEIDVTRLKTEEVADLVVKAVEGDRRLWSPPGTVRWNLEEILEGG